MPVFLFVFQPQDLNHILLKQHKIKQNLARRQGEQQKTTILTAWMLQFQIFQNDGIQIFPPLRSRDQFYLRLIQ